MIQSRLLVALSVACMALFLGGLARPGHAQEEPKWSLAPSVFTTIPPQPGNGETFTGPLTLPIAAPQWDPYSIAKSQTLNALRTKVILRRPVWNLEFSFKPLRMISVDVPASPTTVERRLIWYMVYRIRYLGNDLQASPRETRFGGVTYPAIEKVQGGPHRFFPRFVLKESQELDKEYMDRVIPAALEPIRRREFKGRRTENPSGRLYDSVEISTVPIELSTPENDKSVWGVVTWENIDPRIDFFSIYIQGLSNAFKMEVGPNGAPGKMTHKTLKLNFSRPGDSLEETEREIRFGIPVTPQPRDQAAMNAKYGQEKRLDYKWLYQ